MKAEAAPSDEWDDDLVPIVRPYSRTGGRTTSSYYLALEALVSTSPSGHAGDALINAEHRPIAALCAQVRSVAEVAALLGMPLGVARILLADMAELGLVKVHRPAGPNDASLDVLLMERVLTGLRRL